MKKGRLQHNASGRYEIPGVTYFTSGEPIELLIDGSWLKGRIEYCHNHEDYYFVGDGVSIYDLTGYEAKCE